MYLILAQLQIADLVERQVGAVVRNITFTVAGQHYRMTSNQALVLMQLLHRTRGDTVRAAAPQTVSEIANKLGWRRSNTQACVATLLEAGLLASVSAEEESDRRNRHYTLSARGLTVGASVKARIQQCEVELRRQLHQQGATTAPQSIANAAAGLAKVWASERHEKRLL